MLDTEHVLERVNRLLAVHGGEVRSSQIKALAEVLVDEINIEIADLRRMMASHGHDTFTRYGGGHFGHQQ